MLCSRVAQLSQVRFTATLARTRAKVSALALTTPKSFQWPTAGKDHYDRFDPTFPWSVCRYIQQKTRLSSNISY